MLQWFKDWRAQRGKRYRVVREWGYYIPEERHSSGWIGIGTDLTTWFLPESRVKYCRHATLEEAKAIIKSYNYKQCPPPGIVPKIEVIEYL